MRYLVTGGAGFIGSNTVEELVRRGHDVVVMDDLSSGTAENLAAVKSKVELVKHSITDLFKLREASRGVDYVIHLAARTSVPQSMTDPCDTNRVNVDGTLNVLLAARDAKAKRVVFAGSTAVYGDTPILPTNEKVPPAPISPYGASKLAAETYGQVFGRSYGLEFVSLRYFNVFGPRQDPSSPYSGVLSRFHAALLGGTQPIVFGDGEQSRDFVYVGNVVEANLLACEAKVRRGTHAIQRWHRRPAHVKPDAGVALKKITGRPAKARNMLRRARETFAIPKRTLRAREPCWVTTRKLDLKKD